MTGADGSSDEGGTGVEEENGRGHGNGAEEENGREHGAEKKNGHREGTRARHVDARVGALPGPARRWAETALAVYRLTRETQVSFLAAAIAYYAFVSMVPLVVLGVVAATLLGGDAIADQLVAAVGDALTPSGEGLLRSAVTARAGLEGVTVAGLLVLLWGALKAFRALDRAFSLVYGTDPAGSLPGSIGDAVLALSAVGAGLAAMVVIGATVAVLPVGLPGGAGAVALLLTLFVVFLPLYFLFPDADLAVREVVPGAALAAAGWTVLGSAFGLYTTSVSGVSVYGLLGTVLLALTWLYLGALLLLVGAALNAVRSGHASPRGGSDAVCDQ